jgi:hypothetical protein
MKQYKPDGAVLTAFLRDDESRLKCIRGPVGSGKSTASIMALFMLMTKQPPQKDGKRRSRMVVVRNTNDELRRTTIASWKQMFPPEEWGRFYDTPPYRHEIKVGDIEADVYFLALDSDEDRKKLLSFEITAAWVNEAREVPRPVISALLGRIGRYPAKADGGCRRKMLILDTNAPAVEHWIGIMEGTVAPPPGLTEDEVRDLAKPDDWKFYIQPGALLEETDGEGNHIAFIPNPQAENLQWIDGGVKYYTDYVKGIPLDQARVDVCNVLGRVQTGRPVWPMFKRGLHVGKHPLEPFPNVPLMVGVDFGLTPAAVIGQCVNGRWLILKELVADAKAGMGAVTFAPLLKSFLAQHYPGFRYALIGDPAGDQRAQSDERSPFMIFRACGLPILPAQTNDFVVRKEAVESALNRLVNGYAGLLFDPGCIKLITACEFGYRYAKLKTSDGRYSDVPVKDMHSHVADSFQYLLLGGGEGRALLTGSGEKRKPTNVLKRKGKRR